MNLDDNNNEDLFKTVEFNPNQIKAQLEKEKINETEALEVIEKEKIVDNTIEDIDTKKKTKKAKEKDKKPLTKKQKYLIIGLSIGVVLLIGVLLYYLFANNITEDPKKKVKKNEEIVVEKDNYKYENGTLVFLNSEDKEIGRYECQNKDVNTCYVAYETNDDEFSTSKHLNEDRTPVKVRSKIYQSKYVFIHDLKEEANEVIFLYDFKDEKKIENFLSIKSYYNSVYKNPENNYVFAKNSEGNYGIINLDSTEYDVVVDFKYNYLGKTNENPEVDNSLIASSKIDGNNVVYSIIDFKGKTVSKELNYKIMSYDESHIVVKNATDTYDIYDFTGSVLLTDYDYAKLFGEYLIIVNNNMLRLVDFEGYSLISNSIKLNNSNYDPLYIYDTNLALLEKNISYEADIVDNVLKLSIYGEDGTKTDQDISLLEGLLSKGLDKYSYFDGKLYFYSDVEKTNLIGSYTCTNPNEIKSAESELSNCHIAVDNPSDDNDYVYEKLGGMASPFFFNRYVFVYDSPSLVTDETKEIYVVDLKNDKKNGPFTEIKFENGIRDNSLTDYLTTYVIAKSEGKYGIISLSSGRVGNLSGMKYEFDNIDLANNHFIIKKDNNYGIYELTGKVSSLSNTNKIMSFENQLLLYAAKDGENNYKIYTKDNVELVEGESYKYVYFEGTYIMVVKTDGNIDVLNLNGASVLNGNYFTMPETYKYGTTINYNELYITLVNGKIVFKLRSDENFISEIVLS